MSCQCIASGENFIRKTGTAGKRFPAVLLSYRKLRFHTIKMLREDAHSAQGQMVAEATAPRRENVPRHILFYDFYDRNLGSLESERKDQIDGTKYNL